MGVSHTWSKGLLSILVLSGAGERGVVILEASETLGQRVSACVRGNVSRSHGVSTQQKQRPYEEKREDTCPDYWQGRARGPAKAFSGT